MLDPKLRPATAEGKKWVPDTRKRKRADNSARGVHVNGDDDLDDDGDDDHRDWSWSDDDTDTDEPCAGPFAHTRSKVAAHKTSQEISRSHDGSKQHVDITLPVDTADRLQVYMARLPCLLRSELTIGSTIRFGRDHVVSVPHLCNTLSS